MDSSIARRQQRHAEPELERGTAQRIIEILTPLTPDQLHTEVGGTGVIATYDSGVDGPVLMFRSELDDVAIEQRGGGDRTAMLMGLAERLAAERPPSGKVHLLVQPPADIGPSVGAVLADPAFDQIAPDAVVGIRCVPGHPMHAVVVKPGPMFAAVRSFIIRYVGSTAHAAEPDTGENPSLAIADLLHECDELTRPDPASPDFAVATAVQVIIGSPAYDVSAGAGELHLSIRAVDDERLEALFETIVSKAERFAQRDLLSVSAEIVENLSATINDPHVADLASAAALDCGLDVTVPDAGSPHGNTFGLFSAQFPCCMVLLGAGVGPAAADHPDDDVSDEFLAIGNDLIASGVELLHRIVRNGDRR
ncbi:MAG: M20/M25/M40 family metallo-hydrolase [Ilumatobacter sp.]